MERLLKGKVAVITGGTRGIGYAIVKKFAQEGSIVILCGSRQQTAQKALAQLKSEIPDVKAEAIWPDLTDMNAMNAEFERIRAKYGRIDILANNAGISQRTPLTEYTQEEYDKIMDLNVKAVFVTTQAAVRIMKETGGGSIISTSSLVSLYGQPSGFAYPASKFAVNGMTKSLARELGRYHIRVNAVAPGIVRTDMVSSLPKEVIQPLIDRIPLGRMAEPEDIANAYLYLASDMASYVSGSILSVDGASVI